MKANQLTRRFFCLSLCLCSLWLLASLAPAAWADPNQPRAFDPAAFFQEPDNIFVSRPRLVADLFLGLINIKTPQAHNQKKLEKEVLGCPLADRMVANCRISALGVEKKMNKLKNQFVLPLKIKELGMQPLTPDYMQVTITWEPPTLEPASMKPQEFLDYIRVAADSPLYEIKPGLGLIVFNASFPTQIHVVMHKKIAQNLLGLYDPPPNDGADQITFHLGPGLVSLDNNLASFNIELKITQVQINHLTYKTIPPGAQSEPGGSKAKKTKP